MDIKTSKEKQIRSRYVISEKLFSDIFYTLFDGVDTQENSNVYILKFHNQLVSPAFSDFCIQALQNYLYQPVQGMFQLLDIEYDGEDLYIIYNNFNVPLMSLDLYLKKLKKEKQSSEKRYKLLLKIARVLYSLEQKQLVFGNFSLNNIFITDEGVVILGPAMINLIGFEYFNANLDSFDSSIFLAPEYIESFQSSLLNDVYSFGILSYYIVANDWPYDYKNSIYVLKKAFLNGPKECKDINTKVSDNLNFFIMKSIQFDPSNRWHTFRLIIGILEGKEVVKFEKLSNQIDPSHSFKSDISKQKKHTFNRFFSILLNLLASSVLIILLYIGYQSYFSRYSVIEIPNVVDISLNDVKNELTQLELAISKVDYNFHPSIMEGHVVRIEPPVGRKIKQGRSVKLFVSKGKQELLVPSLIGKTLQEVDFILEGSSIEVEQTGYAFSTSIEKGKVVSQMPNPNQYMFDNGKIQIVISKGLPVTIQTIGYLDENFKKIKISFQFSNDKIEYSFDVFENLEDGQIQKIYSGIFYEGDFFQDEFIIYQNSIIDIQLNGETIYTSKHELPD